MKTIARLNSRLKKAGPKPPPELLKLDFGAGLHKREGFKGVDRLALPGVDFVMDLVRVKQVCTEVYPEGEYLADQNMPGKVGEFVPWPWKDNSVDEAHASHFIEHLTPEERCHFFNELYRVLKPGAKCTVICPYWASARAYGDPSHRWPPIGEWFWYYLDKDWRATQAPHTDIQHNPHGYSCHFPFAGGTGTYALDPMVATRNQDYQQHAVRYWKEAAADLVWCVTKPALVAAQPGNGA